MEERGGRREGVVVSPCDVLKVSESTSSRRIGGTCHGVDEGCRPSTGVSGPGGRRTRRGFGRIRRTCRRVVGRERRKVSCKGCNDGGCNNFNKFSKRTSSNCRSRRSVHERTTTGCVRDNRCHRTIGILRSLSREGKR